MSTDPESWKTNINAKIHQIDVKSTQFILAPASSRQEIFKDLIKSIEGLEMMYSSAPPSVKSFKSSLIKFNANQAHSGVFEVFLGKQRDLLAYSKLVDSNNSHTKVTFESFWKAEDLEANYDQIIECLQNILDAAGDDLANKITRELEAILAGLRGVNRKDHSSMAAWVEIAARFTLTVIAAKIEQPCLPLIVDAAKACQGFKGKVVSVYHKFEAELTNSYNLKGTGLSLEKKPSIDESKLLSEIESRIQTKK